MTLDELIKCGLNEDMPSGDVTTDPLELSGKTNQAYLIAKQDLVLSGAEAFSKTFQALDPQCTIEWSFKDGDKILNKQIVARLWGDQSALLKAERTALNFIGFLSGIATQTNKFSAACSGTKTKILHTRKILPLYRDLVLKAIQDGGGYKHRRDLSDYALIKENHISYAGGITSAVEKIRAKYNGFIEVEVKNIEELKEAIGLKVNRVLLDNMNDTLLLECLKIIPSSVQSEASGNMNLERVIKIKDFGLDYISVGSLTHSSPNADFSLLMEI